MLSRLATGPSTLVSSFDLLTEQTFSTYTSCRTRRGFVRTERWRLS